jgi:hypothetical protein
MSTTLVHEEMNTLLYTCTASETQSAGNILEMTDTIGICKVDIAAGGTGAVWIGGVHRVTKLTYKLTLLTYHQTISQLHKHFQPLRRSPLRYGHDR